VARPAFRRAGGSGVDKFVQFGPVGHVERHVAAATASNRATVCLRRERVVGQHPHRDRLQHEFLAAAGVGPLQLGGNRNVEGESGDVDGGHPSILTGGERICERIAPFPTSVRIFVRFLIR
jgi:hypothetical protein